MSSPEIELQEKLSDLVERCKEVAKMVGEGRDVFAECSYCHGSVPLWEALFTQQLSGFLAHLSCPEEALKEVLGEAAPAEDFDYEGFVEAVERRMQVPGVNSDVGTIEKAGGDGGGPAPETEGP